MFQLPSITSIIIALKFKSLGSVSRSSLFSPGIICIDELVEGYRNQYFMHAKRGSRGRVQIRNLTAHFHCSTSSSFNFFKFKFHLDMLHALGFGSPIYYRNQLVINWSCIIIMYNHRHTVCSFDLNSILNTGFFISVCTNNRTIIERDFHKWNHRLWYLVVSHENNTIVCINMHFHDNMFVMFSTIQILKKFSFVHINLIKKMYISF